MDFTKPNSKTLCFSDKKAQEQYDQFINKNSIVKNKVITQNILFETLTNRNTIKPRKDFMM